MSHSRDKEDNQENDLPIWILRGSVSESARLTHSNPPRILRRSNAKQSACLSLPSVIPRQDSEDEALAKASLQSFEEEQRSQSWHSNDDVGLLLQQIQLFILKNNLDRVASIQNAMEDEQSLLREIFWVLAHSGDSLKNNPEKVVVIRSALDLFRVNLEKVVHPYSITRIIYSLGWLKIAYQDAVNIDKETLTVLLDRFKTNLVNKYIPSVVFGICHLAKEGDQWLQPMVEVLLSSLEDCFKKENSVIGLETLKALLVLVNKKIYISLELVEAVYRSAASVLLKVKYDSESRMQRLREAKELLVQLREGIKANAFAAKVESANISSIDLKIGAPPTTSKLAAYQDATAYIPSAKSVLAAYQHATIYAPSVKSKLIDYQHADQYVPSITI